MEFIREIILYTHDFAELAISVEKHFRLCFGDQIGSIVSCCVFSLTLPLERMKGRRPTDHTLHNTYLGLLCRCTWSTEQEINRSE